MWAPRRYSASWEIQGGSQYQWRSRRPNDISALRVSCWNWLIKYSSLCNKNGKRCNTAACFYCVFFPYLSGNDFSQHWLFVARIIVRINSPIWKNSDSTNPSHWKWRSKLPCLLLWSEHR
jgi:hypothetical protein